MIVFFVNSGLWPVYSSLCVGSHLGDVFSNMNYLWTTSKVFSCHLHLSLPPLSPSPTPQPPKHNPHHPQHPHSPNPIHHLPPHPPIQTTKDHRPQRPTHLPPTPMPPQTPPHLPPPRLKRTQTAQPRNHRRGRNRQHRRSYPQPAFFQLRGRKQEERTGAGYDADTDDG